MTLNGIEMLIMSCSLTGTRQQRRAAASVRHPNVASVFHLYAMQFVEGETLEKLIKRSGRVEVKLALEIAR